MLKLKYFYEQRGFKTVAGIRQPDLWKAEKVIDCPSYRSHPYSKYLASVLHSDINAVKYCEEMLVNIAKLQRGELSKTSWSGNAFFTDIYPDRVEIEHQHFLDDPQ